MQNISGQTYLSLTDELENTSPVKLSPQHEKFCYEYVTTGNATRSYAKAYPRTNIGSARALASKLLTNNNISKRVKELRGELTRIAEEECKAQVINHHRTVLQFDPATCFNEQGNRIDVSKLKEDDRQLMGLEAKVVDGSLVYVPTFPTTSDKHKSAESLAKIMAMNKEQVTVELNSGISDIERAAKLAAILDAARARATGQPLAEGVAPVTGSSE